MREHRVTATEIIPDTTSEELDTALSAAQHAGPLLRRSSGAQRAAWLRAAGAAIGTHRTELVELAARETHLDAGVLDGEVSRTIFQLEHFARVAESPDVLGLVVEPADADYPVAPRPDLVQALQPLGPVLVFTASNFPFAFSVAGNDTASALAAGCPVVVKANPGHPALSGRTAAIVVAAVSAAGAPAGTFGHIQGVDAGVAALTDPRIAACGFTGSVAGGRALFDLAVGRPDPIPFYGELGSLNPVFVTPAAASARAAEIAAGFATSFTFRGGQLCTKPGVLFAPADFGIGNLAAQRISSAPVDLLTDRISAAYAEGTARLAGVPGATVHATGDASTPMLITVPAAVVLDSSVRLQECFGPAAVVVEYDDPAQLAALADRIGPSLTATVHGEADDAVAIGLTPQLAGLAGRIIWNGWPTGVSVTRALHHGGPYPATTAPTYGSIGAGAIGRWLRPVSYQNWPRELLPEPVREAVARNRDRALSG